MAAPRFLLHPLRPLRFALVGLLVAAAACGATLDPSTGLTVHVRRGPISPVEHEGVDNTAPVENATMEVADALGRIAARATTGAEGTATMLLPTGGYRVTVTSCPGALGLPPSLSVTVSAGIVVPVRLVCDTGIR